MVAGVHGRSGPPARHPVEEARGPERAVATRPLRQGEVVSVRGSLNKKISATQRPVLCMVDGPSGLHGVNVQLHVVGGATVVGSAPVTTHVLLLGAVAAWAATMRHAVARQNHALKHLLVPPLTVLGAVL